MRPIHLLSMGVALFWVAHAQGAMTQGELAPGKTGHIPRAVTCAQLLSADVSDAYAAGLLDGVRAFEISFRADVYRLRGDGREELAKQSLFVADAIAERLEHAKERSAAELADAIRESCAEDPTGTAELHFILALESWRRDHPL